MMLNLTGTTFISNKKSQSSDSSAASAALLSACFLEAALLLSNFSLSAFTFAMLLASASALRVSDKAPAALPMAPASTETRPLSTSLLPGPFTVGVILGSGLDSTVAYSPSPKILVAWFIEGPAEVSTPFVIPLTPITSSRFVLTGWSSMPAVRVAIRQAAAKKRLVLIVL